MKIRIAKFIADSGFASRRVAEDLIAQGVVSVNGQIISSPVVFVDDNDVVSIQGKEIKKRTDTELYMFHKPINTMTTTHDPNGRKTIYDVLPDEYKNLKYVGRLDYKTTGLLLMTNDGLLARKLTQPVSQIPRTYIADVAGNNFSKLDKARNGVTIDGVKYRPMEIDILPSKKLKITVTEGKKNEIRIVMRFCGLPVKTLHRVSFGPITLGNLQVGKIQKINQKTIDVILKTFL